MATKNAAGASNESDGKASPKDAKAMLRTVSKGLFSFKESAQSHQWNDLFSNQVAFKSLNGFSKRLLCKSPIQESCQ